MAVDKLERLLNLMATLLAASRPLTADELRAKIEGYPDKLASFRRQFERDKDDLREMGIPLRTEPVPGTDPPVLGYRIHPDDYYLRDPGFTPDELAALHLAVSLVRLDSVRGLEGLRKLEGVVGLDAPSPDDPDALLADLPMDPNLAPVLHAAAERRPVTFTYRHQLRTVDPHRIEYQRGHWYVVGREHAAEVVKNYRIDRIDGEVALGPPGAFTPPAPDGEVRPAQPWEYGEGDPLTAHLLVDAVQAPWAEQHLGSDRVAERRPDGTTVFAVPVTSSEAFRSFVLTFLDHAEVLAPPALRRQLIEWLEEVAS
jgi:predicted DNA-binding transcriptional regulator YafY